MTEREYLEQLMKLQEKRDFCRKIHCERTAKRYERDIERLKAEYMGQTKKELEL